MAFRNTNECISEVIITLFSWNWHWRKLRCFIPISKKKTRDPLCLSLNTILLTEPLLSNSRVIGQTKMMSLSSYFNSILHYNLITGDIWHNFTRLQCVICYFVNPYKMTTDGNIWLICLLCFTDAVLFSKCIIYWM